MNLDQEEEPFLDGDLHLPELSPEERYSPKHVSRSGFRSDKIRRVLSSKPIATVNWLIIIANIVSIAFIWNKLAVVKSYCPEIPYNFQSHNPFAGELKTPEMVKAWEELKIHEILRVTKEELELSHGYHPNSLKLINGGYMGIMRVFHEIHCLDWIKREWNADRWEMIDHLDHCLIALRDGAMCRADLSVGSLYWWPENEHEQVPRPEVSRSCVNWESLEKWMIPRRLEIHNSIAEPPVTPEGMVIEVVLNDDLHTIKNLGEDD